MIARWAATGLVLAGFALVGLLAPAAWGHAFEVQHSPEHGSRLSAAPDRIELRFSEPVVPESVEMSLQAAEGDTASLDSPRLADNRRSVDAGLTGAGDGIYVVSWQVVAASDGHLTAGEFAFAVGDVEGGVPAPSQGAGQLAVLPVASGWMVLAGLSLAAGVLLSDRFLPLKDDQRRLVAPIARVGLLAAVAGIAVQLLDLRTNTETLWSSGPGVAALSAGLMLWLALPLAGFLTGRRWALALVALAAGMWSARSHAAAYGGLWWGVVDFIHLAAAAAWAGSLLVVAFMLWRGRGRGRAALVGLVGAYARLALALVAIVVVTGTLSAFGLLGGLADLYDSGYGLVLAGKIALVLVVVGLAVWARTRALPRRTLARLRRVTTAEAGLLAGVLAATAILVNLGPPVGEAAAADLLGPVPMDGPVARDGGLAGTLNVGIAVGDRRLRVNVFVPSGEIDGTEALITAELPDGEAVTLRPRPCGAGCWEQEFTLPAGSTEVTVHAGAPGWEGGRFTGELIWPPASTHPDLLQEVLRQMRDVPELQLHEEVSSHSDQSGVSTENAMTGQQYVNLAPYAAGDVVDVRPVDQDRRVIEFALPPSRMLFTLWLDEEQRIRREHIVSPGHDIRRTLTYP